MSRSPHKPYKGCQICRPYKDQRVSRAWREPWPVLRSIGKLRRVSRGDLGDALDDLYDD